MLLTNWMNLSAGTAHFPSKESTTSFMSAMLKTMRNTGFNNVRKQLSWRNKFSVQKTASKQSANGPQHGLGRTITYEPLAGRLHDRPHRYGARTTEERKKRKRT